MRENQAIGPFSKGDTTVHCCCHFDVARKKANVPPTPTPTPSLLICIFSKPEMGCTAQWQLK